jgi:hypothetical protein
MYESFGRGLGANLAREGRVRGMFDRMIALTQ